MLFRSLRTLAVLVFVLIVLVAGSLLTYLVVPQPTGSAPLPEVPAKADAAHASGSTSRATTDLRLFVDIPQPLTRRSLERHYGAADAGDTNRSARVHRRRHPAPYS